MPSFAVLVIVALVGLCLWLFFRRGSINHRADVDMPIGDHPVSEAPTDPPTSVDRPGDETHRTSP
jgi:hypothetical protein